eukprot:5733234-Prymnesium_polylepis.1
MKNAFALLTKQQYELASAFFLLGGELESAVKVCARQLGDLQLALVLCRLHTVSAPTLLQETVREELLPKAKENGDSWLRCVAHLVLGEAQDAMAALADDSASAPAGREASAANTPPLDACAATFCAQIASNPRFRIPAQPLARTVLRRCAYTFRQAGMPLAGLEALYSAWRDVLPSDVHDAEELQGRMLEAASELLLQRASELI